MGATSDLIAERGYWGLSLQDVADQCGLTVPGLLRHVGSKVGLLIAVLEHREVEDARALGAQLDPAEETDLRRLCAAIMRRNAGQREIVRLFAVLTAESLDPHHPAHEYFVAQQERTLGEFTRLATGHTDAPETLARQILAMMDGLHLRWLRSPETVDLVQEWSDAADMLFR